MEKVLFENDKYLKILELDKIIDRVIAEVDLKESKNRLANIQLMNDCEEIKTSLNEVNEAFTLYVKMGKFPIYFSSDINYQLSSSYYQYYHHLYIVFPNHN